MEYNVALEKLTPIFRQVMNDPNLELNSEMTAEDVERWDSLSHMMLINAMQMQFGIRFKLSELNKIRSVGDFVNALINKVE